MLTGECVHVLGVNTYFIRNGEGPPLVLFHGQAPGACTETIWRANIDYFVKAGFQVYAFDQLGFGRTEEAPDISMEARVSHAEAFLASMNLKSYSLWGQSSGSYLAARIALESRGVERLVLMASGMMAPRGLVTSSSDHPHTEEVPRGEPTLESARQYMTQTIKNPEALTEDLIADVYAMSVGVNFEALLKRQSAPAAKPILDDLKRLTVPTLLLWGRNDSVNVSRSLLMLDYLQGAELHIFDQCGHWAQLDQAARVNAVVLDFLTAAHPRPATKND